MATASKVCSCTMSSYRTVFTVLKFLRMLYKSFIFVIFTTGLTVILPVIHLSRLT